VNMRLKNLRRPGSLVVLSLILVLVLAFAGCAPQGEPAEAPESTESNGQSGPAEPSEAAEDPYNKVIPFELPDLEGNMVSIADFEGKFVLINFWATWCTYCDQEMPDLQALQDKYQDDLVVLLVNVQEGEKEIRTYLEKNNLTMLTVLDKKGETAGLYNVTGMPASYFVTPDQRVIGYVAGMMTYDTMEQSLAYVREQYESTK
jgi:thiol-disulfide isomerase/thioredoxin